MVVCSALPPDFPMRPPVLQILQRVRHQYIDPNCIVLLQSLQQWNPATSSLGASGASSHTRRRHAAIVVPSAVPVRRVLLTCVFCWCVVVACPLFPSAVLASSFPVFSRSSHEDVLGAATAGRTWPAALLLRVPSTPDARPYPRYAGSRHRSA